MKKVFTLVIIATIAFFSCSKKNNDPAPLNLKSADSIVTIAGDVYPVVKIGNQTWTSVNYRGPGGLFNTGYLDEYSVQHGKLYTPQEALQIVLPTGWRLPSYDDYLTLLIARGAKQNSDGSYSATLAVAQSLMATTGWEEGGGNNYSGFTALPTGFYHLNAIYGSGNGASFLHTAIAGTPPDLGFTIGPGPDGIPFIYLGVVLLDEDRCSIRFVKDN
ncbi:MAG TPA: FISUMP domain-containing protein [Mucilaginibacter sp.]|nr:FISUMP domain-containing protein [Mucilaginibacter sp.]